MAEAALRSRAAGELAPVRRINTLEMRMDKRRKELQSSYDRLAEEYAKKYFDELEKKPIDRELLDRLASGVKDLGPVCDLGCGPGQIARFLHERGATAFGVDLSSKMVEVARRLNPGIEFHQGDMLSLQAESDSWGGIAAFYSIIHIPRDKVADALCEMKRVLKPGGLLLLSFHVGDETMHLDELWGKEVSMESFFFSVAEVESYLKAAGFEHLDTVERPPYKDVEYQSQRAYLFARKPDHASV